MLWFGLFGRQERSTPPISCRIRPAPGPGGRPRIAEADYRRSLTTVHEHILAGDVYQANLTFQAEVRVHGSPLALYAGLRERAAPVTAP